MPDIQFNCPECGQNLNIDEDGAGMTLQCPGCSKDIIVPNTQSKTIPSQAPMNPETENPVSRNSGISKFLNEQQDPKVIQKVYEQVKQILTQGEEILYIAVQKKPVANFSPDSVVLTNKRFIIFQPSLFGLKKSFKDYIWRDLKDAQLKEGIMGATITMIPVAGNRLMVDYLPKKQARKLYSIAQEMEQKVREERRVRALEDKRAAAGGVTVQGAVAQPVQQPQQVNTPEDPMDKLKKLKDMFDADLISEEEFNSKKAEILSKM